LKKGTVEERQPRIRRNWKRILLFTVLFLVLVGSLLYYFLPSVLYPLRIDSVPAGAYVVPWLHPSQSYHSTFWEILDNSDIDTVMAGALKLNITFRINMWNDTTRVIPSTVYLGHDQNYLFIGGKFVGMYNNPWPDESNVFGIYFDVANDGMLKTPESGSRYYLEIDTSVYGPFGPSMSETYGDMIWAYEPDQFKRSIWWPAENYLFPHGTGGTTLANMTARYDNSTGTVNVLLARRLRTPGTENSNAFQMRPGERWTMGFLLELYFEKSFDNRVDGWPRNIYPYLSNDSSWWPKLVIDLTNPPANI